MKDILFTTADFIRSVTIVSDNLQDKYILSSIREAQDIEFQQVVGTRLYNRLKLMVEDESILLDYNEHYRELLDKAQYFISYKTLANLTVNSTYKINNIGLNTISDDNVSTPSITDTFKLSKYYTDKADHYKMMLQNWLLKNKSYFPELLKSDISELSANVHSAASCNVFLGGARGKVSRVPSSLKDESQEASKPFTTGELNVTENGVYLPKDQELDAFNKVTVNVQLPKIKLKDNPSLHIANLGHVDLNFIDTSELTDLSYVLMSSKMESVDVNQWVVNNVTSLNNIFSNCSNITSIIGINNWNVSNVNNLNAAFNNCVNLKNIDISLWGISKITNLNEAFRSCQSVTELNLANWNTSNLNTMLMSFYDMRKLERLDISNWDMSNVTNLNYAFGYNRSLVHLNMTNAILPKMNINNWDLGNLLTVDSVVSIINALPQLDGESYTISLGSDNIAKLSDEQKEIATNKGWTLQ